MHTHTNTDIYTVYVHAHTLIDTHTHSEVWLEMNAEHND